MGPSDLRIARIVALAAAAAAGAGFGAEAAYIVTPIVFDGGPPTVAIGGSITVGLDFFTFADDVQTTAILRVELSTPGAVISGYDWSPPYVNGGLFDLSTPFWVELPEVIDALTLDGTAYPAGVIDFELANLTGVPGLPPPTFGAGVAVAFTIAIPRGWTGADHIVVTLHPDTVANGFVVIPTFAGAALDISIESPSGDVNGDGVCNGADLGLLLAAWGPCPPLSGDLNGDSVVDGTDLGVLLAAWGTANGPADLDGSGAVDGADLGFILGAFGDTPEPCLDLNADGNVGGSDLAILLGCWTQ